MNKLLNQMLEYINYLWSKLEEAAVVIAYFHFHFITYLLFEIMLDYVKSLFDFLILKLEL